ncbi:MAG: hypothetical protein ACLFQE_00030 [Thermotogota bacterium]
MKKVLFLMLLCVLTLSSCVVYVDWYSFFTLEIIEEARARILAENPGVELSFFEFTASPLPDGESSFRGDTTVDDLIWWEFVFNCNEGQTAIIRQENGVWQASEIVNESWLEDVIFESYLLSFDLADAIEILKMAQLGGNTTTGNLFDYVVFRQPLHPDITEPYYIFTVGPEQYVFVGAITGIVESDFF